ncbi:hypothetical protein PC9H_005159 [Pleurotus ostreatus]|uniref:Protein kinase domain-containing protein n=1 Tax=Pleurotus ostreatus TaxID=5322 RepID=A0A8H7DU52_PLEOS|nr:uncharacterized protein PC9H_005159 [Pleurotus ostreatus]KAF7433209.1 hypothetical protein PC9H_005159 [Pleurotus ostreatus]KAJ8698143.1 hypothetical protein PTI98_004881 [Pleurotus ostreatus]
MGPRGALAVSLGKTAAQIAADFAPIPGLMGAVELLCGIVQLCENVTSNRHAAFQLRDRCHTMLLAFKDSQQGATSGKINEALNAVEDCLLDIKTKMDGWTKIGTIKGFTRQREIQQDIERCHEAISDCVAKFQLVSHMELHQWQHQFEVTAKQDHDETCAYLAEIQNGQQLTQQDIMQNTELTRQLMGMVQQLMQKSNEDHDRTFSGLSSNLHQLQVHSGQLLPDLNLKSGEVQRVGTHPVSGSAAMDIYEGLYLQREKVAIKIIRAVNACEQSLRRFNREVKIWNEIYQMDHGKHILPFYGFCQNDGPYPYMVSPWMKNGSVINYVKSNDNQVDYRKLVKGIMEGVQVLHTMQPPVVHGDLKGNNIVVDNYANPLIADFGLSQIVEDITGIPFTQSRGVSDSYRWFAPEVCVGQGTLSVASDIYALAMTILEVLTHKQPFNHIKHTTEVVIRSARGDRPIRPTDQRVLERGLDDNLWMLLNQCWALEATDRPDIQELIQRLQ